MDSHLNFYPSVEKKANNICNITIKTKFIVDNIYVAFLQICFLCSLFVFLSNPINIFHN